MFFLNIQFHKELAPQWIGDKIRLIQTWPYMAAPLALPKVLMNNMSNLFQHVLIAWF